MSAQELIDEVLAGGNPGDVLEAEMSHQQIVNKIKKAVKGNELVKINTPKGSKNTFKQTWNRLVGVSLDDASKKVSKALGVTMKRESSATYKAFLGMHDIMVTTDLDDNDSQIRVNTRK